MSRKTTFKAIYKSKWENGVEIQAEVFVDDERGLILTDIPMDPEDNGKLISIEMAGITTHYRQPQFLSDFGLANGIG